MEAHGNEGQRVGGRRGGARSTSEALVKAIDGFTSAVGRLLGWLTVLPLVCVVVYEVVMRYAFNRPTIWAFDVVYMVYGSLFVLGAAYTLLRQGHIRTDILYGRWPARLRARVDLVLYVVLFFPAVVFLAYAGWQKAVHSWLIGETSELSPWRPRLYLFRAVLPIGLGLLTLQGVSEFIKAVWVARDEDSGSQSAQQVPNFAELEG